ncbi:hypothetical protein RDWZM_010114 [Blomia tropicalis]|uniref:Chitin-binding type-2 domain-containing protein n=1 Tax=Blomia tropicalis TaxID=40697 RepID=A0A9Q0LYG1_BLOTA|nr:hypothetical protein RDWZM_010114 [Blomia tropicalis]
MNIILVIVGSVWMMMLVSTLVDAQTTYMEGSPRQVEIFVNVYDHPKTGFTCHGKAPGQYYADPATKCAVYYVCIANPTGTLSPQSFACPNGTIFSQATRVCRPHEEVHCPLALRYYDNTQGLIDTKETIPSLPIPVSIPIPVPNTNNVQQHHPNHQPSSSSDGRRQSTRNINNHQPQTSERVSPQPVPTPNVQPQQQGRNSNQGLIHNSNLFNSNVNRHRNTRPFGNVPTSAPATSSSTTTTTTTTTQLPPPASNHGTSSLSDYEYDYSEYGNDTANAASSLHSAIAENIAQAIASETAAAEKAAAETMNKKIGKQQQQQRRRKRNSSLANRRKGQLADLSNDESSSSSTINGGPKSVQFTCEDKVPGVAYADIESNCTKFFICVTIGKGKLWSYHLSCDAGKRFNQSMTMCDETVNDRTCSKSEHLFPYNKWHKASKKYSKKQSKLMPSP